MYSTIKYKITAPPNSPSPAIAKARDLKKNPKPCRVNLTIPIEDWPLNQLGMLEQVASTLLDHIGTLNAKPNKKVQTTISKKEMDDEEPIMYDPIMFNEPPQSNNNNNFEINIRDWERINKDKLTFEHCISNIENGLK